MAVVIESSQSASAAATNTVTVTKPTGLAVNDLLVAFVYAHDDTGGPAIATPSGWTAGPGDADVMSASDVHEYRILYKMADSGDVAASNFSFTAGSTVDYIDAAIIRVSGIRTDTQLGGSDTDTLDDTDNPTYTVSLAPAQNNILYCAMFTSFSAPYTATDVVLNGTNPTWTRYLNVSHTVDATGSCQAFAAVDASPESSITSVDPTETGSDTGTDSDMGIIFFLGKNDASTTPTFVTTANNAFAPSGQAGAQTTPVFTETSHTAFNPDGTATTETTWTNESVETTNWTNET